MTAYETVMVVLGILALPVSFGGLLIALLTFLDKRKSKKKMPILSANRIGGAHKSIYPTFEASTFGVGAFFIFIE